MMRWTPKIVKEPAANHRYGKDISRRGDYVYAAYSPDGNLVAIAATAKEARRIYTDPMRSWEKNPNDRNWTGLRVRPTKG